MADDLAFSKYVLPLHGLFAPPTHTPWDPIAMPRGRYVLLLNGLLHTPWDPIAMPRGRYQKAEYRISVYGRKKQEWDQLADWVVDHKLYSQHNRWLIQIPRLYGMYHDSRILARTRTVLACHLRP